MPATSATIPNRSCRYCKAKFKPLREDQRFCKPDHRKAFWKYGGLPFDKMKDQLLKTLRKELREIIREEITRCVCSDSLLEFRDPDDKGFAISLKRPC